VTAIIDRRREDGSWVNANERWMEGNPVLVTSYALMALANCQP
jgi:squalene-hopene/tetraprenyl-beta-curcumene cyclase